MSFPLESCLLHFWSPFPGSKTEEFCQSPETTQKTNDASAIAVSKSDFIKDPKELKDTGFFDDLAFLDDLEDPIEKRPVIKNLHAIEYARQDDTIINDSKANHKQIIASSCKSGQNSDNSTKKTSLRRSKRIAEKRGLTLIENPSRSIGIPSFKKRKYPVEFKREVAKKIETMSTKELGQKHRVYYKTKNKWMKLYLSLKTV